MCQMCDLAKGLGIDPKDLKRAMQQGGPEGIIALPLPLKAPENEVNPSEPPKKPKKEYAEPELPEFQAIDAGDVQRLRDAMMRDLEAQIVQLHFKMITNRQSDGGNYPEIKKMLTKYIRALHEIRKELSPGAPNKQPLPDWMQQALNQGDNGLSPMN